MDDKLEKLVAQLQAGDVDARVDAATKLQAEFEAGTEVRDSDALITNLKTCLRTSNNHLQTAVLSCLPPLLPLLITHRIAASGTQASLTASTSSSASAGSSSLIDPYNLRQLLLALLPSGGVIDRLGEAREKPREKAREIVVLLGGYAFRSGATGNALSKSRDSKGPETPLMMFERFLREGGLSSKVWRVREQSMYALVHIRRTHHLFPIRPYLPLLIAALEDTDSKVRDCARESTVELFTGPGVTDAARADLKKEMAKKNVRKQIADVVLSRVLAGSTSGRGSTPQSETGSETGGDEPAARKEYVPPSMKLAGISNGKPPKSASSTPASVGRTVSQSAMASGSRPQSRAALVSPSVATPTSENIAPSSNSEVQTVYIASSRDLENEFAGMLKAFDGKETEHNWAPRERAIIRVRGMIRGEVHVRFADTFMANLKSFLDASLKTLASLRTTVAANTCSLYSELALTFGNVLDPYSDLFYTNLSNMAGFTKKIIAQQSQATLATIISHTSAHPRTLIPLLFQLVHDKNTQARFYAAAHIKTYIEAHGIRSRNAIEAVGGHEMLEKCVRRALGDANVGVREASRPAFWSFDSVWHDRAAVIMGSLDAPAQKQLQKACPNPNAMALAAAAPTAPVKKSSVAAAIAASRAKAKAIANAPPTLMHQATSASHAMRATSPPFRRAGSPSLSNESAGSPRRPSASARSPSAGVSQSPPRARVASSTIRSTSGAVPISHSRSVSGTTSPNSPPSSPGDLARSMRRTSSAFTTPERTLQVAAQTALPASPPSKTLLKMPARTTPPRPSISTSMSAPSGTSLALGGGIDGSLLMATQIAIPEDADSEMDDDEDPTLSTPQQAHPGPVPSAPSSQALSLSPPSESSMRPFYPHSPSSGLVQVPSEPIIEDALRARAEQAESAAERLLELVEPEEDGTHISTIPQSLLNGTATPRVKKAPGIPGLPRTAAAPVTPLNRTTSIMRQAALFQDSPAQNGQSKPLLFDVLDERKHETGWWLKRMSVIQHGTPLKGVDKADRVQELTGYISALEAGEADVTTLQKLSLLSYENPSHDSISPVTSSGSLTDPLSPSPFAGSSRSLPSLYADMWTTGKKFDRLFGALMNYLDPSKAEAELEYALIVVYELMEHQAELVDGHESDLFTALLRVRYCNKINVLEATNTLRDALANRVEPVYGLTTMHASLKTFQVEPLPSSSTVDVKSSTYAFGLIALGKFIVRLPSEVLEEELPRLKSTLISALSDTSSLLVRESAAASIIAAQLVLRDESHLFSLLDGLPDEKKNLLAYLFDKHGARGAVPTGASGADRLQREMRRLDTRTSTPPRASTVVL